MGLDARHGYHIELLKRGRKRREKGWERGGPEQDAISELAPKSVLHSDMGCPIALTKLGWDTDAGRAEMNFWVKVLPPHWTNFP